MKDKMIGIIIWTGLTVIIVGTAIGFGYQVIVGQQTAVIEHFKKYENY